MNPAGLSGGWRIRPQSPLAEALLLGLSAATAVAGGWALAEMLLQPALLTAVLGALLVLAALVYGARAFGALGLWVLTMTLGILAGEMAALPFGGQSAHLLWSDALLAIGAVLGLVHTRGVITVPRAPFLDALWPFLAWSSLTLLVAGDLLTALAEFKEWVAAAVLGLAALSYATDERRARQLLAAVALTGAVIGLHMFYAAATSRQGLLLAVMLKVVDLPWGRTNYLAGLLILALPITIGLLSSATAWRSRLGWCAVLLATVLGLVLSTSKGAILSLAIALTATFLFARSQTWTARLATLAVLVAAAVLCATGPFQLVLQHRLSDGALDYSAGERFDLYRLAWDEALRHPLCGLGLNNFSVVARQLRGIDTVPHNFELGFLAELGLPGLVLALLWLGAVGRLTWRARHFARTPRERGLASGLWAGFLGFAVHNQFESTLYGQQFKLLLFVTAAATWRLLMVWRRPSASEAS